MTGVIGLGFFLAVAGLKSEAAHIRRLARFVLASSGFFAVASLFQVRYDDPRGLVFIAILTAFSLVCARGTANAAPRTRPDE